jgi:HB1, ASXL, restriction endonuclease HTH domain
MINSMAKRQAGNYLNAAFEVLRKAKEPLHYVQITEQAIARGLIKPRGYTPEATMRGQLNTAVKSGDLRFVKLGPGVFALQEKVRSSRS